MTGRDGSVGIVNGVYFVAAAGGAVAFGRAMDRLGRRPGLAAAYLLLGTAGALCGLGVASGSFPTLLGGVVLFGIALGGPTWLGRPSRTCTSRREGGGPSGSSSRSGRSERWGARS